MSDDPFVITSSGIRFYPSRPEFKLTDIAHSLCMNARFNGHVMRPYSVGQHSMMVADIVRILHPTASPTLILEALLHDGTEAYLTDVPAPLKASLPDWKKWDHELDQKLRKAFKLPAEPSQAVKTADCYALFIEAEALLPIGSSAHFEDPHEHKRRALKFASKHGLWLNITDMDPQYDREVFMSRLGETWGAVNAVS